MMQFQARPTSDEENKHVQRALFALGYGWRGTGIDPHAVQPNAPVIFAKTDGTLIRGTDSLSQVSDYPNPDDFTISETGQVVNKARVEPIFAGHCELCKDMSTNLVPFDEEFKSRAKQYREAFFGQELPSKFSIEPHGSDGGYALYFGRDMHHHGANLCKLSEFDAKGEETRKMIVVALNEKYTEKY